MHDIHVCVMKRILYDIIFVVMCNMIRLGWPKIVCIITVVVAYDAVVAEL